MNITLPDTLQGHLRAPLERVAAALQDNALPPALLLTGPEGVGKKKAALELARLLSCSAEQRPCQQCLSCRMTKPREEWNGDTPWMWLLPIRTSASGSDKARKEERQEKTAEKARQIALDPWILNPFDNGVQHSVHAVRDILERLALADQKERVVIIPEAERFNAAAANALLKTLEEAPQGTWFLLTTSNKARLLPTILSRCMQVPIAPMSMEDFAQECSTVPHIDTDKQQLLYRLSDGCWGKALYWTEQDLDKVRAQALGFMKCVQSHTFHLAHKWLQESKVGDDRSHVAEVLEWCYVLVGDMIALRSGILPRNRDLLEQLNGLSALLPEESPEKVLSILRHALHRHERNISPAMNLPTLALEWQSLLTPTGRT